MCGIVGVAGNTFQRDMKIFRDMLIFDQVRGFDSTGVVAVPNAAKFPLSEKDLDGPDNLWNYGQSGIFDYKGVSKICNRVMIGHNRAATVGNITVDNAHPFTFDQITGVHNGSLNYWYELEKDEDGNKFDVDSKALLKTIAVHGIDEAWEKFDGAASLVWWDSDDETLNFARNKERPMCFAYNKTGDILLWASEAWMIEIAASRHNLELKVFEEEVESNTGNYTRRYKTYPTKTDHFFKFKVTANSVNLVEDRKLEKKSVPPATSQTHTIGYTRTSGTGGGNYVAPTDPDKKINGSWAKGKEKAGKEHVGRSFRYKSYIHHYTGIYCNPYIVGEFLDGDKERIEIYPKTMGEFQELVEENEKKEQIYVLGCRPRIINTAYNKSFYSFGVGAAHIKLAPAEEVKGFDAYLKKLSDKVFDNLEEKKEHSKGEVVRLYKTFAGKLVEQDQWEKELSQAGGCCDFCGMSIDIEDASECLWVGDQSVVCPECKDEKSFLNYMGMEVRA